MHNLLQAFKSAFSPKPLETTQSYYIPSPQYADSGVELSVWRAERRKPTQDWRGNTGRIYNKQVLALQGPLLFPLDYTTSGSLGQGPVELYGQSVTVPVAGFAGRPAQLSPQSVAAEYHEVQGPGVQYSTQQLLQAQLENEGVEI